MNESDMRWVYINTTMSFNVEICTTENQIKEALDIRRQVFCFDYGYKPEDLTDKWVC